MATARRAQGRTRSADSLFALLGLPPSGLPRVRPVYRGLVRAMEQSIATGTLTAGTQLPPERSLAAALGVSRATVVRAYVELESLGLLRGHVGRGTFVAAAPDSSGAPFAWRGKLAASALRGGDSSMRELIRDSVDPALLSVAGGVPALECFPLEAFRRSLDRVLARDPRGLWGHGTTEGLPRLREVIARRIGSHLDNVLILAGAQQGLDLLARCLIEPGDTVVVDRPGYLGAIHSFRAAGARLVGWDVVRHDLDELEDLLVRYRPKLIYTNPTFHNPTGWTMPIRLRRDLLQLAARFRVPIVEDETYRELYLSHPPPPSLRSLDEQSLVITVGTFSKALAPALRLGWMTAAEPIVEHLALIKQRADPHTQSIAQLVVADLIENGGFDAHLTRLRAEHRRRRDALCEALQKGGAGKLLRWTVPDGGLYLWCRLRPRLSAAAVLHHARAASIAFVPGQAFFVDRGGDMDLRVCFASVRPADAPAVADRLTRSIERVARMNGQAPLVAVS